MEALKNLAAVAAAAAAAAATTATVATPTAATTVTAATPAAAAATATTTAPTTLNASQGPFGLQTQYDAQTLRLREIHKARRPKNTTKTYEPKQKEWEEWCARLEGNTDGTWVTEDKLCLFLEQEVINRESRAPGYHKRKAKRKETWKDTERARKKV